jgi:hypothetical protein
MSRFYDVIVRLDLGDTASPLNVTVSQERVMYQMCTSTPVNSGELRGLTVTQIPIASRTNDHCQVRPKPSAVGS